MEVMTEVTIFPKCCSDLDGVEILEERLELERGELRSPLAAGLLIQSVDQIQDVL